MSFCLFVFVLLFLLRITCWSSDGVACQKWKSHLPSENLHSPTKSMNSLWQVPSREASPGCHLMRSETGLFPFARVQLEPWRMVKPVMGLCFVPWSTVHLAVSPYNFVHLNCSSWVLTTDLLTSWGGERQSEKEEENVLVESSIVGSSHPPVLNPLPATQKNPELKRRRLRGSWFKQKREMWIWMMFCVSFLTAHQEPKNHFIPGKQWLSLVAYAGPQQRWEDVCTQPSLRR